MFGLEYALNDYEKYGNKLSSYSKIILINYSFIEKIKQICKKLELPEKETEYQKALRYFNIFEKNIPNSKTTEYYQSILNRGS